MRCMAMLRDNDPWVKRVIMPHVFANDVSKLSSDIFSFKYQNCFCCLTAAFVSIQSFVKFGLNKFSCEYSVNESWRRCCLYINHPDS